MSAGTPAQLIWGPMLIGTFLNVLLYGVSVTQMYMYYSGYKKDKPWMRAFIIFLFLADTVNTAFDMQMCYDALVNHFGDQTFILAATWVFAADPVMTGMIGMSVQLFFSWRIKVLTGSIWAALFVGFFGVVQFLAGLATSIAVGIIPHFLDFQIFKPAVVVWLAGSAFCDSMITVVLVTYLRRNKTGFVVTDGVVDKIIRLTVQTGAITSAVAIIDLVLFLANPAGLHLAFNIPLSKLYTNSLLSSLNARGGWAYNSSSRPDPQNHSVSLQQRRRDVVNFEASTVRPEVYVNVESHEMTDQNGSDQKGRSFMDPESLDSKEDSLSMGRPTVV
ncbi:uncharacterized protein STEHIDRAFT_126138 [Stereum hirsutum FP-91666 SS1]|uniref:DUF6534 domain-containing protein n=1 Tax=Stereum hirsutum (strain FP-91666) TaxID=721885 RepID=R7RYZ8_STEHR|nr:uncharacterized protein STEHIDRAFT_126138 [Stereum hirsutum FP-91666 SS1]EIM80145.1 hypothetical protein STEHIDRAFT_126138 [Stereum hirsutum FP-91666 SS1]